PTPLSGSNRGGDGSGGRRHSHSIGYGGGLSFKLQRIGLRVHHGCRFTGLSGAAARAEAYVGGYRSSTIHTIAHILTFFPAGEIACPQRPRHYANKNGFRAATPLYCRRCLNNAKIVRRTIFLSKGARKYMTLQVTSKIWRNGKLIDWDDAKIHVMSHVI